MKRILLVAILIFVSTQFKINSQGIADTSVYLITCGPGTETYSIYGHSALRVIIPEKDIDLVYNWGVFDFSVSNFAYKFAKGRLEYMLDTESYKRFLQYYLSEQRWVEIQKINLSPAETYILMTLVAENLKPENVKYRYDFFYDDCSTRIRDLLEKATGNTIIYTPSGDKIQPTFRFLTGKYQQQYPWLDLGIDILMGTPSNKKASDRDKMFLPIEMQELLSDAYISRTGKMIPLLQNPETVLDFSPPVIKPLFLAHPLMVFGLICVALIIFTSIVRGGRAVKITDIAIFSVFSILALLMLFSNFVSDHEQMKKNLCLLWLNPFILVCLAGIILNKPFIIWFRVVFFLSLIAFFIQVAFPLSGNGAFLPLTVIICLRSSVRGGFRWNPLSVKPF